MPFCPFDFGVSLLKLNSRKKGTLIINWLLGNLVSIRRVAVSVLHLGRAIWATAPGLCWTPEAGGRFRGSTASGRGGRWRFKVSKVLSLRRTLM